MIRPPKGKMARSKKKGFQNASSVVNIATGEVLTADIAFEAYLALGPTRTAAKTHESLIEQGWEGASEPSIRSWSSRNNWRAKIIVHEAEARAGSKNSMTKELAEARLKLACGELESFTNVSVALDNMALASNEMTMLIMQAVREMKVTCMNDIVQLAAVARGFMSVQGDVRAQLIGARAMLAGGGKIVRAKAEDDQIELIENPPQPFAATQAPQLQALAMKIGQMQTTGGASKPN